MVEAQEAYNLLPNSQFIADKIVIHSSLNNPEQPEIYFENNIENITQDTKDIYF